MSELGQGGTGQSGGVTIDAGKVQVGGDIVGGDKITHIHEAAQLWRVPRQIPPPPWDFTGRATEIAQVVARAKTGAGLRVLLHGMGGIGKSALALAVAHQVGDAFPDGQLFIEMAGTGAQPLAPSAAMAQVIRAWHPTTRLPEDEASLAGLYRSTLHGQRALLLLDNVAGVEQVRPLLPPVGCGVLLTSRRRFHLPGLVSLALDELPRADAVALLRQSIPHLSDDEADTLADHCGDLPLALALAGGALATHLDLPPALYLRRLDDVRERLDLVEASLSLSYDLLDAAQQRRWCALAIFPGSFARAAAAALWDEPEEQEGHSLSTLVAQSLVQWDAPAAGQHEGRYHLHDLARLFAETRLSDAERTLVARRHSTHYCDLLALAQKQYLQGDQPAGLALFDMESENIATGQRWAAQHVTRNNDAAALCSAYPDAGTYILRHRQTPREQISWLEAALDAARLLDDQLMESKHLGSLGVAYAMQGEMAQAIPLFEQRLGLARRLGDKAGEATVLGNLGLALYASGEVLRGIDYQEQALALNRVLGERRGESNALGGLGIAYASLGNVQRAIDYHEQALTITRELGDRRGTSIALGNLANAHRIAGNIQEAIRIHEEELVVVRVLGDRGSEATGLWNLAQARHALGEWEEAMRCAQLALTLYEEVEHPEAEKLRAQMAAWEQARKESE